MSIKRLTKLLALSLAVIMCAASFTACASSEAKYREAFELTEQGDYEAAYALFTELGGYKDAKKEAAKFRYAITSYTLDFTDEEGPVTSSSTISYNEHNLPAQNTITYSDGFQHTCTYTYNENGKILTVSCVASEGFTASYEHTYSEDGKLLKIEAEDTDGYYALYEYFYDEKGNQVKVVSEDDGVFITYEISYDADNRMTETIQKDKDGNQILTEEYLYDEKGNLIKHNYFEKDSIFAASEYTYNELGHLIKEHYTYTDTYVCDYEYTCDANGNPITEHITNTEDYEGTYKYTYKLVYIPFEYSDEEWEDLRDSLLYW